MNAKHNITYDRWHGYRKLEHDGVTPTFPFGFGLNYTTFKLDHLNLERNNLGAQNVLAATLDMTNCSAVASDTIVQFYTVVKNLHVERAPK